MPGPRALLIPRNGIGKQCANVTGLPHAPQASFTLHDIFHTARITNKPNHQDRSANTVPHALENSSHHTEFTHQSTTVQNCKTETTQPRAFLPDAVSTAPNRTTYFTVTSCEHHTPDRDFPQTNRSLTHRITERLSLSTINSRTQPTSLGI